MSEARKDEFCRAVYELALAERPRATLIIGAKRQAAPTKALLAGALAGSNDPSFLWIERSNRHLVKARARCHDRADVSLSRLSSPGTAPATEQVVKAIRAFQASKGLHGFDVVFLKRGSFGNDLRVEGELATELAKAKYVILEDIEKGQEYLQLMTDAHYLLVTGNATLRGGYAIFRGRPSHV
jgi:hypothetical protein